MGVELLEIGRFSSACCPAPGDELLQELDVWLNERGASLGLRGGEGPVSEKIERYELRRTIDPAHFLRTLDETVPEYIGETGATRRSPGMAP